MDSLAYDKATVRSYDQDGRLHIAVTNISKAIVNPYLGNEIPDYEALGLVADHVYQLLRDPNELAKAAPTFNNIPLLSEHVPVTADDHQPGIVVGSTGTDAEFKKPYLRNSLVIWATDAINGIESNEQRELSCAYRYRADMTPGSYEGTHYDGVMRDIYGNHVALVAAGRAGSDVIVGDSILKEVILMKQPKKLSQLAILAKGALMAVISPKLAADALNPLLANITAANWKTKKTGLAKAVKELANDADLEDIVKLLDTLDGQEEVIDAVDEEPADPANPDDEPAVDALPVDKLLAFLKDKLSEEDLAAVSAILNAEESGEGENPPAQDEPPVTEGAATMPDKPEETVSKPAMDAALELTKRQVEQSTIAKMRAIQAAEKAVFPYVGEMVAQDSAEAVYRVALTALGINTEGLHPSAFKPILEAQPKPVDASQLNYIAMDAVAAQSFADRFPMAETMNRLG